MVILRGNKADSFTLLIVLHRLHLSPIQPSEAAHTANGTLRTRFIHVHISRKGFLLLVTVLCKKLLQALPQSQVHDVVYILSLEAMEVILTDDLRLPIDRDLPIDRLLRERATGH